jgi:hypothetical protein
MRCRQRMEEGCKVTGDGDKGCCCESWLRLVFFQMNEDEITTVVLV